MPSVFEWLHLNLRGKVAVWHLRKTGIWKLEAETFVLFQSPSYTEVQVLSPDWIYVVTFPLPFQFFLYVIIQHEDHWLSPVKPAWAKGQWPFPRSVIGWVHLSQSSSFVFSGKEIQSQSNCKILSGLKPGQGCLSSANIFGDHFCDRDWKEYRK